MSMAPLGGIVTSAAGTPLSQTAGSESERTQKDALSHSRQADSEQKAERAAGIGQTEQDQESSERDADGRRLWEMTARSNDEDQPANDSGARQGKDTTGQCGTKLDLTG